MKILYFNRRRVDSATEAELSAEYVDLKTLLQTSDFVTIHTPYTSETHHIIGESQFALMKSGAYLINTARGPVVDEKALVRALQEHRIAGAGLDVYENEPAIEPELMTMPNTVLLPHIASASLETRTKMAVTAAENLVAVIKGERPPNVVNPEIYGGQ
jgi:glyoxylate reductase